VEVKNSEEAVVNGGQDEAAPEAVAEQTEAGAEEPEAVEGEAAEEALQNEADVPQVCTLKTTFNKRNELM
jgi:hypothetical protein